MAMASPRRARSANSGNMASCRATASKYPTTVLVMASANDMRRDCMRAALRGPVGARGGDIGEGSAILAQNRRRPGEGLPALYRHVHVGGIEFNGMAGAASHLRGDDGGAGAAERVVHRLTGRRV